MYDFPWAGQEVYLPHWEPKIHAQTRHTYFLMWKDSLVHQVRLLGDLRVLPSRNSITFRVLTGYGTRV